MKASKMTNEQLAHNLEATIPFLTKEARHLTDADEIMTEAAVRLRRPTPVDDDLLKMAKDLDKLRAKLKVAEDALGIIAKDDLCLHREMAARALCDIHAIAKEGGAS